MSKAVITFEFDVSGLTFRQRQSFEAAVVVQAEAEDDNEDEQDNYPDVPHISTTYKEDFTQ